MDHIANIKKVKSKATQQAMGQMDKLRQQRAEYYEELQKSGVQLKNYKVKEATKEFSALSEAIDRQDWELYQLLKMEDYPMAIMMNEPIMNSSHGI